MDWSVANSALAVTLIGVSGAAIGYFYRARTERLQNYRLALFILLKIWHRFGLLNVEDFNPEIDSIINSIKRQFPDANFSDEEIGAIKVYFTPYLRQMLINKAFEGFESIEQAYAEAVHLVSLHDPIYGYELDSIKSIRSRMVAIDQYFASAFGQVVQSDDPNSQFLISIQSKLKSFAHNDAISDIESAIHRLSWKVGVITRFRVKKALQQRKDRLTHIPENEIQRLIDEVLVPAIQTITNIKH
ncbi:MAG: hypothetical protein P8Y64_11125 [Gammaproteobacteria bacterium]